jgi:hypothetical protein
MLGVSRYGAFRFLVQHRAGLELHSTFEITILLLNDQKISLFLDVVSYGCQRDYLSHRLRQARSS